VQPDALSAAESNRELPSGVSDESGRFRLHGLAEGRRYGVRVSGTAFGHEVNVRPRTIEDVAAGTRDLRVVLEPGGTISGRVVDSDGRTLREVSLDAYGVELRNKEVFGSNAPNNQFTDSQGRFTIPGLKPGAYRVIVSDPSIGPNQGWMLDPKLRVQAGSS